MDIFKPTDRDNFALIEASAPAVLTSVKLCASSVNRRKRVRMDNLWTPASRNRYRIQGKVQG